MKFKDKDYFITIARSFAYDARYLHDYIPEDVQLFSNWVPHDWVVKAMDAAYTQGLADSKEIRDGK